MQHRLINALKLQPVDRTPIWLMRQAGRYLPEYRAVRAQAGSFTQLCKTPELACAVTLQPLHRFDLDAAIIFSDILTLPDAMGLGLYMNDGEGPCFERPVQNLAAIKNLPQIDPNIELKYVMEAIQLVKRELAGKVPLIGFAGSPWTVATYMVEGKTTKDFKLIKRMLYQQPECLHQLLNLLAKNTAAYLSAQIAAGADIVMLFDTWGGILTEANFKQFSLQYMQLIVDAIKDTIPEIPIILFCKDGGRSAVSLSKTGAAAVGLDWMADARAVVKLVDAKVALQGNLDPAVLYGSEELISAEVSQVLDNFRHHAGHIFNLGHGIAPDVDPDKVAFLVAEVKAQSGRRVIAHKV